MNLLDKVIQEWSFKTKKGYPDINSKEDMDLFESMFGFRLNEEKADESDNSTATDEDVNYLRKAFNLIKDDYAKYLKVFMLFDPNSLGTISEVLLTKLLAREGIETQHTGGAQGLTDLIVNGHRISLKTTSGSTKIGLGSEKEVMDSKAVQLANHFKNHPELSSMSVGELATSEKAKEYYPDIITRIDAVAKKLTGTGNDEFFVWVEKTVDKKTGVLKKITIHTLKYDYNEIIDTFSQGRVVPTKGAGSKSGWKLVDAEGNILIVADIKSKYLNISPAFIRRSTGDTTVSVEFPSIEQNKVGINKIVSKSMFTALDNIYAQIYGSATEK